MTTKTTAKRGGWSNGLLVALLLCGGCFRIDGCGESTRGDRDRSSWSIQSECFFGCATDDPLMLGTTEEVSVRSNRARANGTRLEAAIPEQLRVEDIEMEERCCADGECSFVPVGGRCAGRLDGIRYRATVTPRAAGDVGIRLVEADGGVFDETSFDVREPARIEVLDSIGDEVGDELLVRRSGLARLTLTVLDADGAELRASSGIRTSLDDEAMGSVETTGRAASVTVVPGDASGDTTLRIRAGAIERAILVRFED